MSTETKVAPQSTLRRRMNILERAQSSLMSGNTGGVTLVHNHGRVSDDQQTRGEDATMEGAGMDLGDLPQNSSMEYMQDDETDSSSSDNEADREDDIRDPPGLSSIPAVSSSEDVKPSLSGGYAGPQANPFLDNAMHAPATTRAWYEIDFAVIIALISPLGNWLTGGDYVKNALVILFMVFYLHQIIEIPWTLYQNARPRRRPTKPSSQLTAAENLAVAQAETQLYKLEVAFLFLALVSPFFGSVLLHIVLGPEALSWFSTTLFILSTGIRPWRHLIYRLSQRTSTLHDIVHYPNETMQDMTRKEEIAERENQYRKHEIDAVSLKVMEVEKLVDRLRKREREDKEMIYEYVDDAIEEIERSIKRWMDKAEEEYGAKAKDKLLAQIQINTVQPPSIGSLLKHYLPSCFKFFKMIQRRYGVSLFGIVLPSTPTMSPHGLAPNHHHKMHRNGSAVQGRLETILEAEEGATPMVILPAGTHISTNSTKHSASSSSSSQASTSGRHGPPGYTSRPSSSSSSTIRVHPSSTSPLTSSPTSGVTAGSVPYGWRWLRWIPGAVFMFRLGYVMSLPLRSVVGGFVPGAKGGYGGGRHYVVSVGVNGKAKARA